MASSPAEKPIERHPFRSATEYSEKTEKMEKQPTFSVYELPEPQKQNSWHGTPAVPEIAHWENQSMVPSWAKKLIKSLLINGVLMLFPLAYIALCAFIAYLNNTRVHGVTVHGVVPVSADGLDKAITNGIKIAVTGWTIIVGLIICRVLKTIAHYKVERGTRLLTLEQIIGSKSFGSAMLGPYNFKRINTTMICLFALWALSPLVSQALQRLITEELRAEGAQLRNVSYVDLTVAAPLLSDVYRFDSQIFPVNQLFASSLMTPFATVENSPVDTWGNPKIPTLESVKKYPHDDEGWHYIGLEEVQVGSIFGYNWTLSYPSNHVNVSYSSMFGLPIASIPRNTSHSGFVTTFEVESAYFTTQDCSEFKEISGDKLLQMYKFGPWPNEKPKHITNPTSWSWTSCNLRNIYCSDAENMGSLYVNLHFDGSRETNYLTLASQSFQGKKKADKRYEYSTCAVATTHVQSRIQCGGRDCRVVAMRQGTPGPFPKMQAEDPNPPHEPYTEKMPWQEGLIAGFAQSTMPRAEYIQRADYNGYGQITLMEKWLHGQKQTLKDKQGYGNMSHVSLDSFTANLGLLFNSYYHATIEPIFQTSGLSGKFPKFVTEPPTTLTAQGPSVEYVTVYQCHWLWWGITVASCGILIGLLVLSTYLDSKRLGPDIMGYMSSVTMTNSAIPLPPGGSLLDGLERTQRLADLKVRMHDVRPDQPVGHVAISSLQGEPLQRGRKYA